MTIDQMRARVKEAYTTKNWQERVKKMTDDQIIAIYHSLLARGKIR